MPYRVLINDTIKDFLLGLDFQRREQIRKAFEFLETGLWDGGLRVKKLKGLSKKTIFEGRLNRGNRLLFTLGNSSGPGNVSDRLIYVWGISDHDHLDQRARTIVPGDAPFLRFEEFTQHDLLDMELDELEPECFSEASGFEPHLVDHPQQRWFVLDEREWRRLSIYETGDFEIALYLTPQQAKLLQLPPPLFLSGTAGSGKTTLAVYYLLRPHLHGKPKIFLTYNSALRNFSERLYWGLTALPESADPSPPEFLTFSQLCRRLIPRSKQRFPPEKEIRLSDFERIFKKWSSGGRFDSALVWEEIRSIIKGAKPPIDRRRVGELIEATLRDGGNGDLLRDLREELLSLARTSAGPSADETFRRQLGLNTVGTARDIEELHRSRTTDLQRALTTLQKRLKKWNFGEAGSLMTLQDYERLGRKKAPDFHAKRPELYRLAEKYQSELDSLGCWDEIDLTRAAISSLHGSRLACDFLVCDEAQDLTDLQIELLLRLPSDPRSVLLAGDPKQIVNPSGFRWEEARQLFYDRRLEVPEVHDLTINFRCAGNLVELANSLILFKQKWLGIRSHERLDQWKFKGRPACVVESIARKKMLNEVRLTGADRIILVREKTERDRLRRELGTQLVMTIREAKGLEFRSVLLWGFGAGEAVDRLWHGILDKRPAKLHDAQIRHEINLLYVGITRARHNLIIYDGPSPSIIWNDDTIRRHTFRSRDLAYLAQAWQRISSPQEWAEQGDYYQQHEHYAAAAECFRNGNRKDLMLRALALDCEQTKQFAEAAAFWFALGETARAAQAHYWAEDFQSAADLWLRAGEVDKAEDCRLLLLESAENFEALAIHWEKRGDLKQAVRYWKLAKQPARLAPIQEKAGLRADAAASYRESGNPARAAALYRKIKKPALAAECLQEAGHWEEALTAWRRLKRPQGELICLARIGDPLRLARYFERQKEWLKAFKNYQQAFDEELCRQFALDLEKRLLSGSRAIRLSLLDQPRKAAEAWEKVRCFEQAAEMYSTCGEDYLAARCHEKAGQWIPAIKRFADNPDRRLRNLGVKRCLRKLAAGTSAPGLLANLERLALDLKRQIKYEPASLIYETLGYNDQASLLAVASGDIARSFRLSKQMDLIWAVGHLAKEGRFRETLQLIDRHRKTADYRYGWADISKPYQNLIDKWVASGADEADWEVIDDSLGDYAWDCDYSWMESIFSPRGCFDKLLQLGLNRYDRDRENEQVLRKEAHHYQKQGFSGLAGIRYLWLEEIEPARECFGRLEVDSRNLECNLKSGRFEEALCFLSEKGDFTRAVEAALFGEQPERARQLARKSTDPEACGRTFNSFGQLEAALECFERAENLLACGFVLQQLGCYQEAANSFQAAGDDKAAERCRRELQVLKQAKRQARLPGIVSDPDLLF